MNAIQKPAQVRFDINKAIYVETAFVCGTSRRASVKYLKAKSPTNCPNLMLWTDVESRNPSVYRDSDAKGRFESLGEGTSNPNAIDAVEYRYRIKHSIGLGDVSERWLHFGFGGKYEESTSPLKFRGDKVARNEVALYETYSDSHIREGGGGFTICQRDNL